MGKSLGMERNFEEVCFELGTEYWYRLQKTSFGYQEGINSRIVNQLRIDKGRLPI